jgi:hypothetical protein
MSLFRLISFSSAVYSVWLAELHRSSFSQIKQLAELISHDSAPICSISLLCTDCSFFSSSLMRSNPSCEGSRTFKTRCHSLGHWSVLSSRTRSSLVRTLHLRCHCARHRLASVRPHPRLPDWPSLGLDLGRSRGHCSLCRQTPSSSSSSS